MDNGCPKCEKLAYESFMNNKGFSADLCLRCQLEQAEQDRDVAIKKVEELKQKIAKEKEDAKY